MLGLAFALAVASPNLEAVDDSNAALTSCLFAVMREQTASRGTRDQIAAALASGCAGEEARYRGLAIAVLVARGQPPRAAAADVDALLARTRSDMIAEHERFVAPGLFEPAQ